MKNIILLFLSVVFILNGLVAQDTLPKFSLKNAGNNRILLGWTNNFENVKQISIQRSFDSLKNFKTIFTVVDPSLPENGYLDTKAPNDQMFYRLYIMLGGGSFLFSDVKKPVYDTTIVRKGERIKPDNLNGQAVTLNNGNSNPVINSSRPKADIWVPSKFVYTQKDGYLKISLPEAGAKKYTITFFTEADEKLFELKDITEKNFEIDKSNFYHAGWFKFELYEDGELKEKNKFYLPKEF